MLDAAPPFSDLFREHAPRVGRALRNLGVIDADLPEALRDAFVTVHRTLPSFRGESSVGTWIYGVALRIADAHRRPREARGPDEELLPPTPSAPSPMEQLARIQALGKLDAAMDALDAPLRAAFVLYELEDLSLAEIALAAGIPVRTAYARLVAARASVEAVFAGAEPAAAVFDVDEIAILSDRDPPRLSRQEGSAASELVGALRAARGRAPGEAVISATLARLPAGPPGSDLGPLPDPPSGPGAASKGTASSRNAAISAAMGAPSSRKGATAAPSRPSPPSPAPPQPSMASGALVGGAVGVLVGIASLFLPVGPGGARPHLASSALGAPSSRPPIGAVSPTGTLASTASLPPTGTVSPTGTLASTASLPPTGTLPEGPAAGGPSQGEAEGAYLERARGLLAASPAEALALADGHAGRFPEGKLGADREAVAVEALSKLGRGTEAKARARVLLTLFPDAPARSRIEGLFPDLKSLDRSPPVEP